MTSSKRQKTLKATQRRRGAFRGIEIQSHVRGSQIIDVTLVSNSIATDVLRQQMWKILLLIAKVRLFVMTSNS